MTKKTKWYPAHVKPVREGWYERDYTGAFEVVGQPNVHLDLWLQKSPGRGYWYVDEPKGQINDAYFETLPWRGIKRKSK